MFKNKYLSFLKYNLFEFGEQKVSQFVVFECKYLFSIIFFYFHKSNSFQDRFHTHAFNAISILLFGNYVEELLLEKENFKIIKKPRNRNIFLYIPKDSFHRITKSNGCLTLLLSGPWKKEWKEYINSKIIYYSWGRK